MGSEARQKKGAASPPAVAAMASSLVLVVGLGVTAYFVEVRGTGFVGELQGARGLEILVLLAALGAVAVTTQLAVAAAARQVRGGQAVRQLLQRALALDSTDPDARREFESVPEVRDLVAMLVAEKTQVRDLGDRVEMLRGEMDGLAEGMRRSAADLGRMRREGLSDVGLAIAASWNALLDRVKEAIRAPAESAAESAPSAVAVEALVARLDELEAELQQLRIALDGAPVWRAAVDAASTAVDAALAPAPAVAASSTPDWQVLEEPAAMAPASAPAPTGSGSVARFEDIDFPHFVGRPVRAVPDRVEVTYEGQDGEEVVDLPASALLFESEAETADPTQEPVLDLRTLGARESER